VSLIVLVLGTLMNYLIAVRSQKTENVIDLMYMNEKKSSSKNYYLSTSPLYSGGSFDGPGILMSEDRDECLQNNAKIYAVLSFILLAITSLMNIIRSYLCTSKL
jgi:hypothetical protein